MLRNTNELLGVNGIDGVKTGRTARAGDCLVLSAACANPKSFRKVEATAVYPRHLIVVIARQLRIVSVKAAQMLARGWQLYDQWAAGGRVVESERRLFDSQPRK